MNFSDKLLSLLSKSTVQADTGIHGASMRMPIPDYDRLAAALNDEISPDSDIHVVVMPGDKWSGLTTMGMYLSKAAAENAVNKLAATAETNKHKIKFAVMTLTDYIDEKGGEERREGYDSGHSDASAEHRDC